VIGIDTNILVRHLTQDDPIQSPRATHLIERVLTQDHPGFISLVTIVETVWVLRSSFRLPDAAIAAILEQILEVEALVVQNAREVFFAAEALRKGEASFDDALIGALGAWAGCTTTFTFDRKAARLKDFKLA
jgi:predicted nucleic-acid-binding protein